MNERPLMSEAQKAAAELAKATRCILDMADEEAARADAMEAILREGAACNFGPGEWREKARRVVGVSDERKTARM